MATLHFIHESANTFYVTGYGISRSESGRYDELLTGGRMTKCFARLGGYMYMQLLAGDFISDIESDTLNVTVNGNIFIVTHRRQLLPGSLVNYENVFFRNGWDDLVHMLRLTPRIPLVFTNFLGKTFAMMVFTADGWELTYENLDHTNLAFMKPIRAAENGLCLLFDTYVYRWAGHDSHFDESDTFYRPLLAHTIPAEFLRKHELYTYDHAILHHRGVEYKLLKDGRVADIGVSRRLVWLVTDMFWPLPNILIMNISRLS
ncbi:hypothetical protein Tco_0910454 [Tanacetum coccineum]|uniref:Uncharacterized protein n=1 Tax=Tanacetum coccineum TaxID=301880 RepID=A0ABQ5CZ84_9ASTR